MISIRPKVAPMMFHDEDGNPLDEILVKQCFAEECDINNIVNRFQRNGCFPLSDVRGVYGDFSEIGTYQDALIKIQEADEMFDSLPAQVRAKFDNDTAKFLEFVDDPTNIPEMLKLGLITDVSANVLNSLEEKLSTPTDGPLVV